MDPQRRRLTDTKSTISFISSIFGNGGKLSQLFKDKKLLELGGLGFGTAFMVGGFILSFFSSPSVDPNTELLKSINQTVTATYEAVLLIQDELYAVANSLVSLQNQITAMFNALNDAILKTQCTSSFGTLCKQLAGQFLRVPEAPPHTSITAVTDHTSHPPRRQATCRAPCREFNLCTSPIAELIC